MVNKKKKSVWLKGILEEFGIIQNQVTIFCENQGVIQLSKRQGDHKRTKHIDVKLYFLRDMIDKGVVVVKKIDTTENLANCLPRLFRQTSLNCVESHQIAIRRWSNSYSRWNREMKKNKVVLHKIVIKSSGGDCE